MTDRIKSAFDGIHAENELKKNTLQYIQTKTGKNTRSHRNIQVMKFALVSLLFAAFIGGFSHRLYYTEAAYIDLDINPSLEISVNRFERVIGVDAYNKDGELLLSELSLTHMKYDDALKSIIDLLNPKGLLQDDGLVSVTLNTIGSMNQTQLLLNTQSTLESAVSEHHTMTVSIYPVDNDTKTASHNLRISPAKYLAILELQALDPATTFDGCRNHTVQELQQQVQAHGNSHNGTHNGNQRNPKGNEGINENQTSEEWQLGTHHGNGRKRHGHGDWK